MLFLLNVMISFAYPHYASICMSRQTWCGMWRTVHTCCGLSCAMCPGHTPIRCGIFCGMSSYVHMCRGSLWSVSYVHMCRHMCICVICAYVSSYVHLYRHQVSNASRVPRQSQPGSQVASITSQPTPTPCKYFPIVRDPRHGQECQFRGRLFLALAAELPIPVF